MFRGLFSRVMVVVAAVTVTFPVFATGLGAEPLFKRVPGTVGRKIAEKLQIPRRALVRSRVVKIRMDTLREKAKPPATATPQQRRLILNLFDGLSVIATSERVKIKTTPDFTWIGRIEGPRPGRAVLVIRKGKVYGNIRIGTKLYQIRPTSAGRHLITEIDMAELPDEGKDVVEIKGDSGHVDDSGSDSDIGSDHKSPR